MSEVPKPGASSFSQPVVPTLHPPQTALKHPSSTDLQHWPSTYLTQPKSKPNIIPSENRRSPTNDTHYEHWEDGLPFEAL